MRLVTKNEKTSSQLTSGRVEVFYSGHWGMLCGDGFDFNAANALCQTITGSSTVLRFGEVQSEGLE